jgi:glycosyltransferase involved in cell wall biosynthesis
VRHKGAQHLLEAYRTLETDKKLVIAGGGAFTDAFVEELHQLGIRDDRVIFTGSIEKGSREWQELYSNAYVFVLPSESEGLPIALLEAMSFGRCVLASTIPQNVEAIAGGFGFTFKNKNVVALRRKLAWLLENPATVKKVGALSRDHVEKNYNWEDIIHAIESMYICVLDMQGKKKLHACIKRVVAMG